MLSAARLLLNTRSSLISRMATHVGEDRKMYRSADDTFDVAHLVRPINPFKEFEAWFREAKASELIDEANAACLATANKQGLPSARMVLVKQFGADGFVFYTNKSSRKGAELAANPNAALVFYWDRLRRQVRIEGRVQHLPDDLATEYFHSRPVDSQLSAVVSKQSCAVSSREELAKALDEARKRHEIQGKAEKPEDWGGYRVIPHMMEFWQGQTNRLHDRLRFRLESSLKEGEKRSEHAINADLQGWFVERLAP